MRRGFVTAMLLASIAIAGCSGGGTPKAVTPVTTHDFGNVPVVTDMKDGKQQAFIIQNEGTGDLRLSNLQVKLLEGC